MGSRGDVAGADVLARRDPVRARQPDRRAAPAAAAVRRRTGQRGLLGLERNERQRRPARLRPDAALSDAADPAAAPALSAALQRRPGYPGRDRALYLLALLRSEERRVGKECRSRW